MDWLNDRFTGIESALVLGPTRVRLKWFPVADCTRYEVYSAGSSVAMGSTKFSSYTLQGLSPDTSYQFAVAGISCDGSVDGIDKTIAVRTWPRFLGVRLVTAPSATTLVASWSYPVNGPTFKVYVNPGTAPYRFSDPAATTTGTSATITQLADGSPIKARTSYFVIVWATYLDQTTEQSFVLGRATTPPGP